MWISFFILSTSASIHLIYMSFLDYYRFDVITDINVINENPSIFPTITICNLQPRTSLMFTIDQILIDCTYDRNTCNSSDFDMFNDPYYGICYRFNGRIDSIRKVFRPGKANGFQVKLFTGLLIPGELLSGLHLNVHNISVKPTYNEGIDIPTGLRTNLIVNRIFSNKLEFPYDNCKSNVESNSEYDTLLYMLIKGLNQTYRQKDCFDMCFYLEVQQRCNCSYPIDKVYEMCIADSLLSKPSLTTICAAGLVENFYKETFEQKCLKYCPLECDSIDFQLSMSLAELSTKELALQLMNKTSIVSKYSNGTVTLEKLMKSIAVFRVYYDELKYTCLNEKAKMSLQDIVSNFGGILGLFLGTSFLSFAEFIDLFIEVVFHLYERNQHLIKAYN